MKNRYSDLTEKVVFVTGAASGIGQAQAKAFLEQGSRVFGFDQQLGRMDDLSQQFSETFAYFLGDITNRTWIPNQSAFSPSLLSSARPWWAFPLPWPYCAISSRYT